MEENVVVRFPISLPRSFVERAKEVHKADPAFLNRVVLSSLTRRFVYNYLRTKDAAVH